LSVLDTPISNTPLLDKLPEGSEPLGHILNQDKGNIRGDIQWFQTLPHSSPQWKKEGVTGIQTWWGPSHGLTDILIMKTMFKPDFSLSDILPITRHVKDKTDLSPLWAPSDFSLEKRGKCNCQQYSPN
jgi:hypothetical protein